MSRLPAFAAVLISLSAALLSPLDAHAQIDPVRTCDIYGTGYYYIPGTDRCADSRGMPYRRATPSGTEMNYVPSSTFLGTVGSTVYGNGAQAMGDGSTAVGVNARSNHDNSIALGVGVETSRVNQVVIGNTNNTYTLGGIASAQSRAAQSGPVGFVTSDASGNLAVASFDPTRFEMIGSRVDALEVITRDIRQEGRRGVAAAIAMASAPMPSAIGRTSWVVNTGTFKGEWAFGGSIAHRLPTVVPVAVTAGYAYGGGESHAARFGLTGEF